MGNSNEGSYKHLRCGKWILCVLNFCEWKWLKEKSSNSWWTANSYNVSTFTIVTFSLSRNDTISNYYPTLSVWTIHNVWVLYIWILDCGSSYLTQLFLWRRFKRYGVVFTVIFITTFSPHLLQRDNVIEYKITYQSPFY